MLNILPNDNTNINIIFCPSCRKNIPTIKLILDQTMIMLQIECICTTQTMFYNLKQYLENLAVFNKQELHNYFKYEHDIAYKYCTNCSKWLCNDCLFRHHVFNVIPCTQHNHQLTSYSNDCYEVICNNCSKHYSHMKTECITYLEILKKQIKKIRFIIKTNKTYKNRVEKWIDANPHSMHNLKTEINHNFQ